MKTRLLKVAYETEDGYVYEAVNYDDFSKVLRILGTSSSHEMIMKRLKENELPFNLYKKEVQ